MLCLKYNQCWGAGTLTTLDFILELFELDVDGFTDIIPFTEIIHFTSSCGNLVDSSKGKPKPNKKTVHFRYSTFLAHNIYINFLQGCQTCIRFGAIWDTFALMLVLFCTNLVSNISINKHHI